MNQIMSVVQVLLWLCMSVTSVPASFSGPQLDHNQIDDSGSEIEEHVAKIRTQITEMFPRLISAINDNSTSVFGDAWTNDEEGLGETEGRKRKKKHKKQEIMMLTKMLMALKVALLGIVLPLAVLAAKMLSWKAVTLSLLAFMLAKIVFVKNLVMGKSSPSAPPPSAPAAPIIIHSPPSHDSIWKRASHPRIHLQPEVHVHHSEEHHSQPSPATWTWAEESRVSKDPHQLAFGAWLPKMTQ